MVIGLSGVNLWGPICSVITQVFNKMGRPRCGSPICSITSAITDRIGEKKCILFCERAFYTNYIKSGKILLAETLSYVTNSSVLENPCLVG